MLCRIDKREMEREAQKKIKRLTKWLMKLNKEQKECLEEYCEEANKNNIISFGTAFEIVLRVKFQELFGNEFEAEALLDMIIDEVELEGKAYRNFKNGSVEYMANIKKEKDNIISKYIGAIKKGFNDKEAYEELKAAYPMFTASALKNVIAEYKRDKKKAAAKKPNNETEEEIELNPNMSTEEIAKSIINCDDSIEDKNKANTEDEEIKGKIIRQEEKESSQSATDKQNEEIKSKLIEITEVRKFKGQFGIYEKTKDGVRVNGLTVTRMSDIDSLKKQVNDKYDEELQNFLKNQEARKNISYGRLGEMEQLLNIK